MGQFEYARRSGTLHFSAPPGRVFPLFGPVREAEWAEGWEISVVHAQSELLEESGAIFLTRHPGEPETIWYIRRFDLQAIRVEYLRITPGSRFGIVSIQCHAGPSGGTDVEVTYEFHTLSEQGSAYLALFTESRYREMLAHWQQAIDACLRHGLA